MSFLRHEEHYRTRGAMKRLASSHVTVCGAGALGSHIAIGLARAGVGHLRVIDHDRVEEQNLSTQPYGRGDVGSPKARLLAHGVFRAVGVQVDTRLKTLTRDNARALLRKSDVVVDAFDNSESRAAVQWGAAALAIPCVHAGLAADYSEVVWDPGYVVPSAALDDVCDYPLARNLSITTAALAAECVLRFLINGSRTGLAFTFEDLCISRSED
ncbi:MAG: ThiF family adenylyltransferase [Myxococcota bacterium]